MYRLGFIGCGNMGGALARAAAKKIGGENIAVCDHRAAHERALREECNTTILTDAEVVRRSKFVLLGVKPQALRAALANLTEALHENEDVVLVSMAAGTTIARIRQLAGRSTLPVVRIMPNTPVLVGKGTIPYCTADVCEQDEADFLDAFSLAGIFDRLAEEKMDAATALSGCSPAFVYAFAEALADGGVACGVPLEKAALYTAQTLLGAAEMLLTHGQPRDLIDAVCSPGGATLAGMRTLEEGDMQEIVKNAVVAAYRRATELNS